MPLGWACVNKNKDMTQVSKIFAKSRLVLPGHTDPHLGDFRADAPQRILWQFAFSSPVSRGSIMYVFDVSTAFLSGNPTTREVYAKAPEGGLPATERAQLTSFCVFSSRLTSGRGATIVVFAGVPVVGGAWDV